MDKKKGGLLGSSKNEYFRRIAHESLDRLMDSVDGVSGNFGNLGIDIPFQNGYFHSVEEKFSRRHRADGDSG